MPSWARCRSNLIPADFQVNRYEPPLMFADHSFDLIYGISVFTHLDKASQEQWIPELYRLLRPGGALIMTVNGTSAAEHAGVDLTQLSKLPEQGVVFLECDKLSTLHPDWYQTSFNEQAYTQKQFATCFGQIRYLTRVFGWQDAVVCRKALNSAPLSRAELGSGSSHALCSPGLTRCLLKTAAKE